MIRSVPTLHLKQFSLPKRFNLVPSKPSNLAQDAGGTRDAYHHPFGPFGSQCGWHTSHLLPSRYWWGDTTHLRVGTLYASNESLALLCLWTATSTKPSSLQPTIDSIQWRSHYQPLLLALSPTSRSTVVSTADDCSTITAHSSAGDDHGWRLGRDGTFQLYGCANDTTNDLPHPTLCFASRDAMALYGAIPIHRGTTFTTVTHSTGAAKLSKLWCQISFTKRWQATRHGSRCGEVVPRSGGVGGWRCGPVSCLPSFHLSHLSHYVNFWWLDDWSWVKWIYTPHETWVVEPNERPGMTTSQGISRRK